MRMCGCALCAGGGGGGFAEPISGSFTGLSGKPSYTWDQAAQQITRDVHPLYLPSYPSGLTLTYAYRTTANAPPPPPGFSNWIGGLNPDMGGFQQFNAAQITFMETILDLISDVANITFNRVGTGTSGAGAYSDSAQLLIGNYSSGTATSYSGLGGYYWALSGGTYYRAGKAWFDATDSFVTAPSNQNFGASLYLHEIMHTIGLSHPGNYNAGGGATYAGNAIYNEDSGQFTVMSYFDEANTGADFGNLNGMTPLLHDIAALQRLYGANTTTRTGNTTYGFGGNTGYDAFTFTSAADRKVFTIWDAGGIDTLNLSGFTTNSVISLIEETFSSAGTQSGGGAMVNNISIARGAVVENAVGGSGNDSITGNEAGNRLTGNNGNDTLVGNGGTDVLYGGNGNDSHSGGEGNDQFAASAGNDTFNGGNGTGDFVNYSSASSVRVFLDGSGTNAAAAAGDVFVGIESIGGAIGNDIIVGDALGNRLYGFTGNDTLFGRAGADQLEGQDGNDRLIGGTGNDVLVGGANADTFVFADAPAAGGLDRITDFVHLVDRLEIDASAFGGGLVAGATVQLRANAAPVSTGAVGGVFLYETDTGLLSWDSNGGLAGGLVTFARLSNLPTLTTADFLVVA